MDATGPLLMLQAKSSLKRLLPPLFVEGLGLARKLLVYPLLRRRLQANAALYNKHAGQTVYVLANGPSLNNFDVASLHDQFVITMNHFELHPLKDHFRPVAHCMGDPAEEWRHQDPAPMVRGVNADSYWVNADSAAVFAAFSDKPVHYYFQAIRPSAAVLEGSDLSGLGLQYQSTAQMAIMVALFMGFKRINLLGFDHDWLVSRGHSPHFYEEREGVALADQSRYTYTEMIRISLNLFETYSKIAKVARAQGAQIVNLSEPSYLDVFPRRRAAARE